MAMQAREILRWLATLNPSEEVGIDDGGLCLRAADDETVYLEVGGMPEGD
jgi:hypothetical protein